MTISAVTELELPRGAVREYLHVFGVAAVYVATAPGGQVLKIGVTQDLERTLTGMREVRGEHSVDITVAFWVEDRARAQELARAAQDVHSGDSGFTGERAGRAIEQAATTLRIAITSHDAAMQRVAAAVERVNQRIELANKTGGLKDFNRVFKTHRNVAKAAGRRCMNYAEALARLRKVLVKRLVKGLPVDVGKDVIAEALPLSLCTGVPERALTTT